MNRQRNKKKFAGQRALAGLKKATVKIKPKEAEPCRTRNRQPKVRPPAWQKPTRRIDGPAADVKNFHGAQKTQQKVPV